MSFRFIRFFVAEAEVNAILLSQTDLSTHWRGNVVSTAEFEEKQSDVPNG